MDRCSGCPALLNISMPECLKKKRVSLTELKINLSLLIPHILLLFHLTVPMIKSDL